MGRRPRHANTTRPVALAVLLAALLLLAACGGGDADGEAAPAAPPPAEEPAPPATETEDAAQGDPEAGARIFENAGCVSCHILAAAGSSGSVGPNLDEARPSFDKVVERVTNGAGVMPPFRDILTAEEIQDVAAFVSSATRGE